MYVSLFARVCLAHFTFSRLSYFSLSSQVTRATLFVALDSSVTFLPHSQFVIHCHLEGLLFTATA